MGWKKFIEAYRKDLTAAHPAGAKVFLKQGGTDNEGFKIHYAGGKATLEADSPGSAIHGLSVLKTALQSGHVAEFLGFHRPISSFRALWITKNLSSSILNDRMKQELLCQSILLLGYNTVIIQLSDVKSLSFSEVLETFSSYKVQVAVRFQRTDASFFDPSFDNALQPILSWIRNHEQYVNFILWDASAEENHVLRHPKARDFLRQELVMMEINKLKKLLGKSCQLIYSIPAHSALTAQAQSRWIPEVCYEISDDTYIAFSATVGDPCSDWLPPHPLWQTLRAAKAKTYLNLLPLINVGLINQGQGLWPATSLDLMDRYLLRCRQKTFCGAIALATSVPEEDALLSCSLWVASRILWGDQSPHLLAETWFCSYRRQWLEVENLERLLKEVREIAIAINFLQETSTQTKEQIKKLTDCLLLRLRCMEAARLKQPALTDSKPGFDHYLTFFIRDAKRLIARALESHKMPIAFSLEEEGRSGSFWTEGSLADIVIFDSPKKGEDPLMAQIYSEVFDPCSSS